MKKVSEFLKDLLYDSMDYIIMLGIIGLVVFVIGWRLDILFADKVIGDEPTLTVEENIDESSGDDIIQVEVPVDQNEKETTENTEVPTEPKKEDTKIATTDKKPELPNKTESLGTENPKTDSNKIPSSNQTGIISVNIPSGSPSQKIGEILVEHGLVASSSEFTTASENMGLSTKLKSGKFDIIKGSSLEDIIKTISK